MINGIKELINNIENEVLRIFVRGFLAVFLFFVLIFGIFALASEFGRITFFVSLGAVAFICIVFIIGAILDV